MSDQAKRSALCFARDCRTMRAWPGLTRPTPSEGTTAMTTAEQELAIPDDLSWLTIVEEAEPLPAIRRFGGGRPAIPNPYLDDVAGSYARQETRAVLVPVDKAGIRTVEQKKWQVDKDTKEKTHVGTVTWETHKNVDLVIRLLREAAEKQGLGVRIVVDHTGLEGMPPNPSENHRALVSKRGKVRVRFLGQKRKATKPSQNGDTPTAA